MMPDTLPSLSMLSDHLAPASLVGYGRDLAASTRFCGPQTAPLQAASLVAWRTYLAQHTGVSPHTINRRLAAVKRLVAEAALVGQVDATTAEAFARITGVKVPALKARLKPTTRTRIIPGQMRRLCDAPSTARLIGWRDRAVLHTLASSGCRVSEVVSLTSAQVLTRHGSFFVAVLGKNQRTPREAPLSHEAYAAIEAWLARRPVASGYLFTSFGGKGQRLTTRPMHISAAWRLVRHYARQIGLEGISVHSFRKFVVTEFTKRGDIRVAQVVLGHKRLETTARFYVLEDALAGGLTDHLY
jgi:site-specific recombinase XerD